MSDIEFDQQGDWGVITLTREKALNALTWDMVKDMYAQLIIWARDDAVKAVMVCGAGEKAFCAGGDVVWMHGVARENPADVIPFFRDEYRLNTLIKEYPKPYVAMIDGIFMGGGVGISVHGGYRIAGDRTMFAMPETGIGMLPDVGGGHFLARLPGGLGLYYGLTGARAKAADCVASGVATHYVPSMMQESMIASLISANLGEAAETAIQSVLFDFDTSPSEVPIDALRADIERLMTGHETLGQLILALDQDESAFAQDTLAKLARMSPTSLSLAFEQIKRGGQMNFRENMAMELRIVSRIMAAPDFFEGVRALLIDRDKKPIWSPAELSDVSAADIEAYFEPIDGDELTFDEGLLS